MIKKVAQDKLSNDVILRFDVYTLLWIFRLSGVPPHCI